MPRSRVGIDRPSLGAPTMIPPWHNAEPERDSPVVSQVFGDVNGRHAPCPISSTTS
ncbi:MAG TPA: hypothetical protein VGQ52_02760 [Gemmatimonadaceae bacterium]|nr:hypothetical protein [Gemmatimonadaceae bacterium]